MFKVCDATNFGGRLHHCFCYCGWHSGKIDWTIEDFLFSCDTSPVNWSKNSFTKDSFFLQKKSCHCAILFLIQTGVCKNKSRVAMFQFISRGPSTILKYFQRLLLRFDVFPGLSKVMIPIRNTPSRLTLFPRCWKKYLRIAMLLAKTLKNF